VKIFDNKEEVIDLQLTQKGRQLLATGGFKPKYYTFHDTGIIYDSLYAGFTENQNDTLTRIKDETIYLQTQHNFSTVDKISSLEDNEFMNVNEIQLSSQLGENTDLGVPAAPQFSMDFFGGKIVSASSTYTGSNQVVLPIIQIDIEQKYLLRPLEASASLQNEANIQRAFMDNGTSVVVIPDDIILRSIENNTPYQNENFEIEVYLIETVSGTEKTRKLNFIQEPIYVQNDLLLSEPTTTPVDLEITKDYVEYYFDINVDDQITKDDLCAAVSRLNSRNIYIETEFECEESFNPQFPDIYDSSAEDTEACD